MLTVCVFEQLIFCLSRYEAAIDAYLDGLEASGMTDLSKVASAAAFYISRVDATIDKKLEQIGTTGALDLRGKVPSIFIFLLQLYRRESNQPNIVSSFPENILTFL